MNRGRAGRTAVVIALAVLACLLAACGGRDDSAEPRPLRIFAAASLTDVVGALVAEYEARHSDGAPVATSFGGSSALARQIRDGAPADVFLSASPQWMDFLRESEALAGEPIVLARNRLVCVIPADGSAVPAGGSAGGIGDARSLLRGLSDDARVAIADLGVPAGEYARAALDSLGLLTSFEPHLVGQSDVRAVLHAVEQGEVRAGFVYATDAAVARVEVLFTFEPGSHPPIEYQAAALRAASSPGNARDLLEFLRSEEARALLAEAGFAVP